VAALRQVEYKDSDGRLFIHLLPEGALDYDAERGIPYGPPPLDALDLPLEIEVRLNNELFHRRLFTERDLRRRRADAAAAVMAACRLDIERLLAAIQIREGQNA
jgi:hypothetical protein